MLSVNDAESISVIDELPLWSAPFGLKLLEVIILKPNAALLDVGCGFGFPLIEIAQRLGSSCKAYGIDPWEQALERIRIKIKQYDFKNIEVFNSPAENMPFENDFFDLIVSNNGLNNVQNIQCSLNGCARVAKKGAQFVFTLNLEESMIAFYSAFEKVLLQNGMTEEISKMKAHIYEKRRPIKEIESMVKKAGFSINDTFYDSFNIRFLDAEAMFNHSFIKNWFLGSWEKLLSPGDVAPIFSQIKTELNNSAARDGEISLYIPFATVNCVKI
jgi:arsenite methyltransferase